MRLEILGDSYCITFYNPDTGEIEHFSTKNYMESLDFFRSQIENNTCVACCLSPGTSVITRDNQILKIANINHRKYAYYHNNYGSRDSCELLFNNTKSIPSHLVLTYKY